MKTWYRLQATEYNFDLYDDVALDTRYEYSMFGSCFICFKFL